MIVHLGCVLALLYSADCAYAGWCALRDARGRARLPFVCAALLLIVGSLGALFELAAQSISAEALLAGLLLAAVAYVKARRVPFAPLASLFADKPRGEHPWPLDPVPPRARSVMRPSVMTLTLPAIGSVVELNQN